MLEKSLRIPKNTTWKPRPYVKKVLAYIKEKKHETLLFSFLLLIFGDTFSPHNPVTGPIFIYQNFLVGLLVFYEKKWIRYFIPFILLLNVLDDVLETQLHFADAKSWHGILYLVFFIIVAKEVYQKVLYTKAVTRELLAAALCGFVLLCLIGTFIFFQIYNKVPNSFTNIPDRRDAIVNLNYFSFTTLLTIGFGDIAPTSLIAKRAVMLIGLAGHFYTVFITSIIIGKYLSVHKEKMLA